MRVPVKDGAELQAQVARMRNAEFLSEKNGEREAEHFQSRVAWRNIAWKRFVAYRAVIAMCQLHARRGTVIAPAYAYSGRNAAVCAVYAASYGGRVKDAYFVGFALLEVDFAGRSGGVDETRKYV